MKKMKIMASVRESEFTLKRSFLTTASPQSSPPEEGEIVSTFVKTPATEFAIPLTEQTKNVIAEILSKEERIQVGRPFKQIFVRLQLQARHP